MLSQTGRMGANASTCLEDGKVRCVLIFVGCAVFPSGVCSVPASTGPTPAGPLGRDPDTRWFLASEQITLCGHIRTIFGAWIRWQKHGARSQQPAGLKAVMVMDGPASGRRFTFLGEREWELAMSRKMTSGPSRRQLPPGTSWLPGPPQGSELASHQWGGSSTSWEEQRVAPHAVTSGRTNRPKTLGRTAQAT